MEEKKYPRIISRKAFDTWISGCPLQIKETVITQKSEGATPSLKIVSCPCGDYRIERYSAEIELTNSRREHISSFTLDSLVSPESDEIPLNDSTAAYAALKIISVTYSSAGEVKNGRKWENTDSSPGVKLPEQEIYWQTDPLYEQIRRECSGVTDVKYKSDEVEGGWRCVCGQVNLIESDKCGACHVSREWLREHLNTDYLEKRRSEDEKKSERELSRESKRKREGISDKAKALLILGAAVMVVAFAVLLFTLIIPSAKYSSAEKALANGEFDKAISAFTELDDFSDSRDRLAEANYKKAQYLTGIDEVYMTDSKKEPWYSIDEGGVLSFKKDDYTGSWNNFVIPDVFDGVVVRELDRNFFLNCKELTVVTISDCVEVLGEQTFYNCEILHTVNFGKNLREIGARAFINCYALEAIEIPDTVESLGLRAFNNCINLKSAVLGSGITSIGSYQFSLCTKLEKLTLKAPITEIGEYAFAECSALKTIYCRFDESEWNEPTVSEGNEAYYSAAKSFGN